MTKADFNMSPHDFCLWLDGFLVSFYGRNGDGVLSCEGVAAVRHQLKMVRDVAFPNVSNEELISIISRMNPQDHPPKVYGSALACNHANEMPVKCPCEPDCYCKAHSCIENAYQNVY